MGVKQPTILNPKSSSKHNTQFKNAYTLYV